MLQRDKKGLPIGPCHRPWQKTQIVISFPAHERRIAFVFEHPTQGNRHVEKFFLEVHTPGNSALLLIDHQVRTDFGNSAQTALEFRSAMLALAKSATFGNARYQYY